jgi:hypothetical protein
MKNNLMKLLRMVGIFKMTLKRWPQSAAELVAFVNHQGWSVEVSSFHTLTFKPFSETALAVDMAWPAPGDRLSRLRMEMELKTPSSESGFDWSIKTKNLPPLKRKTKRFCLVPPNQLSRKKSA